MAANREGRTLDASYLSIYSIALKIANPRASRLLDIGCQPSIAIDAIQNFGIVSRDRWPDESSIEHGVPIDILEAGDKSLVSGVYRIDDFGDALVDRVKRAVSQRYGVFFGMPIGQSYMNLSSGTYYGEVHPAGNHAQTIVGYRPGAFYVLNSWGLSWGEGGYAWIDEGFFADRAFDITVITAAPKAVE